MCRDTEHVHGCCTRAAACLTPAASRVCPWQLFLWLRLRNIVFFPCFPFSTSCSRITALGPRQQHTHQPHMCEYTVMRLARRSCAVHVWLCSRRLSFQYFWSTGVSQGETRKYRQYAETENMCTCTMHILQLAACLQHRVCVRGDGFCGFVLKTLFFSLPFAFCGASSRLRRRDHGNSTHISHTCGPTQA
jgi:hypothetical protein